MTLYYVSGIGNDKADGASEAAAFRTLQKAVDLVVAGDTVFRRVAEEGYHNRAIASVECIPIRSLEIVEGFGV